MVNQSTVNHRMKASSNESLSSNSPQEDASASRGYDLLGSAKGLAIHNPYQQPQGQVALDCLERDDEMLFLSNPVLETKHSRQSNGRLSKLAAMQFAAQMLASLQPEIDADDRDEDLT